MSWQLIDSAQHDDSLIELFAKDGVFLIRANGLELMNGSSHESETAFGNLVAELAPNDAPRVLIGGLGLGYTLAAAVESLEGRGSITVAEFSPAIIDWFHRHVRPSVLPVLPECVEIVAADVLEHLWASGRYDLVLLDVDNGPEPMVRAANGALYTVEGLRVLKASLTESGIALLWSGFQSLEFERNASDAGCSVARRTVANGPRPELDHHIYVLRPA